MKKFTYWDNKAGRKEILVVLEDDILEADAVFKLEKGMDVAKMPHIGCTIEEISDLTPAAKSVN